MATKYNHPVESYFDHKKDYFKGKSKENQTLYVIEQWRDTVSHILNWIAKKEVKTNLHRKIEKDVIDAHNLLYSSIRFKSVEDSNKLETLLKGVMFNFRTLYDMKKVHIRKLQFIESNIVFQLKNNHERRLRNSN